jgi:hypothetical protein
MVEATKDEKEKAFKRLAKEAKLEAKEKKKRQLIQGCFNDDEAAKIVCEYINQDLANFLVERASRHGLSFRDYVTGERFSADVGRKVFKIKDFERSKARRFLKNVSADCRAEKSEDTCNRCRFETLQPEECDCGCICEEYEGDNEHCKHHSHSSNDYKHHTCSLCGFVQCDN